MIFLTLARRPLLRLTKKKENTNFKVEILFLGEKKKDFFKFNEIYSKRGKKDHRDNRCFVNCLSVFHI